MIALTVVLLTNFDIIIDSMSDSKWLQSSFLTAKNQDSRKSCKMGNFTNYDFSEDSPNCKFFMKLRNYNDTT